MADNIVGITFTDVVLENAAHQTATLGGAIDVDYTTSTITGSLTVHTLDEVYPPSRFIAAAKLPAPSCTTKDEP
jgi:hypothetical protein